MSTILPPMRPSPTPATVSNKPLRNPAAQSASWFEQALKRKSRKRSAEDVAETLRETSAASPFVLVAGFDFSEHAGSKGCAAAIDVTRTHAARKARDDELANQDHQPVEGLAAALPGADGSLPAGGVAGNVARVETPGNASLERLQALCEVIGRLSPQFSFSAARTEMAVSLNHPMLSGVRLRIRAAGPALDVELSSDFAVEADWLGRKAHDIARQLTQSMQRPVCVRLVEHLPRVGGANAA